MTLAGEREEGSLRQEGRDVVVLFPLAAPKTPESPSTDS